MRPRVKVEATAPDDDGIRGWVVYQEAGSGREFDTWQEAMDWATLSGWHRNAFAHRLCEQLQPACRETRPHYHLSDRSQPVLE